MVGVEEPRPEVFHKEDRVEADHLWAWGYRAWVASLGGEGIPEDNVILA